MGKTLATLLTINTYGTWLRGDARGSIDKGELLPPNPILEAWDKSRLSHDPYYFPQDRLLDICEAIGTSLRKRPRVRVYAITLQTWHGHILIGPTRHDIADVVKCAKDAARWHLRIDRPIWSGGYDKRFCFDYESVWNRIDYVERHNLRNGWERKPFGFVDPPGYAIE